MGYSFTPLENTLQAYLVFFFAFNNLIIEGRRFKHWMFLLKLLESASTVQDSWPSNWSDELLCVQFHKICQMIVVFENNNGNSFTIVSSFAPVSIMYLLFYNQ